MKALHMPIASNNFFCLTANKLIQMQPCASTRLDFHLASDNLCRNVQSVAVFQNIMSNYNTVFFICNTKPTKRCNEG